MVKLNKKQRAQVVLKMLEEFFPETPIPLSHSDPYTLLVAVLLSAQSTDAGVNKATPALFKKASTPAKMAALETSEIERLIKTIGLAPTKAKNIKALSQILADKHNSQVPKSFAALEALPGVGHKTASVVMSQAFGHPAFAVDTHIHRLAHRWKLSNGKNVVQTEKDLKRLFPKESWNKLHLQMIYYGRKYCPARNHKKEACPICTSLT